VTGGKQSKERLKADEFCRACLEEKTNSIWRHRQA